jgi:hypothetical protein
MELAAAYARVLLCMEPLIDFILNWDYLEWGILAALLVIACFKPRLGEPWIGATERFFKRLADRKGFAIVVVFAATLILRVALLPVLRQPQPQYHDEFSYLLAADTFAHGHLTNPPHPMALFLDTFHVLQQPTYASMYPPAQGAALAVGQFLGNPWIGVLLSTAGMCAAVLWMLQGWLPAPWAFLGASILVLRIGVLSYWMNSYWGGAVAAIGGALVMGALPRIFRYQRPRDGVLLGLGVGILANSRPLEGFALCIPVAVALVWWLLSRKSPGWRAALVRVALPVTGVLVFTAAFMGYFNWRVTGNPALLAHTLDDRMHMTVSSFIFRSGEPRLNYSNVQFEVFYNVFARNQFDGTWDDLKRISWEKVTESYDFFIGPALLLPFIMLARTLMDRRMRLLVVQCAICFIVSLTVVWFHPHYISPVVASCFALLVQMMRHLRHFKVRGRPIGIGFTRAVVLCVIVMFPVQIIHGIPDQYRSPCSGMEGGWTRARVASQLEQLPGNQLVLVRYAKLHCVHNEWVYNSADIEHAKVVWAREIPGVDMNPLLEYFKGRKMWIVKPDDDHPKLVPFDPAVAK